MPTSRKRKHRRRRHDEAARSPFESLIRGVQADARLQPLYRRALWSFFLAPLPQGEDEEEQDAAMLRALEWFVFDLELPSSGCTPAVEWVERSARQHRWSADVLARYTPLTRSVFGLFEVEDLPAGRLMTLTALESDTTYRVVANAPWTPELGDLLAARLFPLGPAAPGGDVYQLSPACATVPDDARGAIRRLPSHDALQVERLFGASPDWMAEAFADREFPRAAEAFFELVCGEGVRAGDLEIDLREQDDPLPMLAALLADVDPLTSEEPAILGALLTMLWLRAHLAAGASDADMKRITRRAERWMRAKESQAVALMAPSPIAPVTDPAFAVSEQDLARVRQVPVAPDTVWVGRRQIIHTGIWAEGRLPEYPHAILWLEEPAGLIVGADVVAKDASPEAILNALVGAMIDPGPSAGSPRRPARIRVSSRWLASRLAAAVAPLGIAVDVRYSEPALADAFQQFEEHVLESGAGGVSLRSGGYLDLPGSTPEQVKALFEAAARFYEAAPWRTVDDTCSIELQVPGFAAPDAPGLRDDILEATAIVMGAGGETFGLAIYFDPADLAELRFSEEVESALHHDTLAVTFDAERDMWPEMLTEIRRHRWPVAGRRAYPVALRTQPDAPGRLAAGHELDLARIALDAVRQFFADHGAALACAASPISGEVAVEGVGTVMLTARFDD